MVLGMLKQPQGATFKMTLQRHRRNTREMAYILFALGLTCLGLPM